MLEIQNNGIAIFDNAFSDEYCDKLIDYFEWSKQNQKTWNRFDSENTPESRKNDNSTSLTNFVDDRCFTNDNTNLVQEFNNIFCSYF